MYFQRFPKTLYSLDDLRSAQLVTSIFLRVVFSDELKNNLSIYDEYDIKDGETPEIVSDIVYDNPELYWIILHMNEILDPRFSWPLSGANLKSYVESKYNDINGIHHYEDNNGYIVNGNVILNSSGEFSNFNTGNVITNFTNPGNAVIVAKISSSNVIINTSDGGFQAGDSIKITSNTAIVANVTAASTLTGTAVTNYIYEDLANEQKRRIKILKPQYVDAIVNELNKKLENVNG